MARSTSERAPAEHGFTLLEALVAMLLLSIVVVQFLAMRSSALIDAAEARNRRIAREIAEQYLSEIEAGAREMTPENRQIVDVEAYPGFRYKILIGEAAISDAESEMAGDFDADLPPGVDSSTDRLAWQRERDALRRAQSQGLSMIEYEDQLREQELEERIPSEDELEDVAIVVYFPNIRPSDEDQPEFNSFMMKAKVSTMAIEGLTPELAEIVARQRGGGTETAAAGAAGPSTGTDR
jgi:prepilin-type N-terminal cleavage/methylation domain-containing protein